MKKRISLVFVLILTAAFFSGCGSKSEDTACITDYANKSVAYAEECIEESCAAEEIEYNAVTEDTVTEEATLYTSTAAAVTASSEKKIVYTGYVGLDTLEFDKSIETLKSIVDKLGGYIESSDISGNGYVEEYDGYVSYRCASFVVRIPSSQYEAFQNDFSQIGYVSSFSDSVEDITREYYDTETRLNAYQAEADTLTEMLKKTENVSELLEIQARLSEVTYMIDSLTSSIRGMQDQVDYSTVTVSLQEVQKIEEKQPATLNYWERMSKGFLSTLEDIGEFFTNLFLWLVVNLPVLLIIGIIGFALFFMIRKAGKKRKAKKLRKIQTAEAFEEK